MAVSGRMEAVVEGRRVVVVRQAPAVSLTTVLVAALGAAIKLQVKRH